MNDHADEIHALRNAIQVLIGGLNALEYDHAADNAEAVEWIGKIRRRAQECIAEADAARTGARERCDLPDKMSESSLQDSSCSSES